MSRMSRTAKLIVAARAAARGGTEQVRAAAIAELKDLKLPDKDAVGLAKFTAACRLKEAGRALEFLGGEVRTAKADEVIELSEDLMRLPDRPVKSGDSPRADDIASDRFHWMRD